MNNIAFIIDGGHFTKAFKKKFSQFPTPDDVEKLMRKIFKYLKLAHNSTGLEIYRIFYYDCKPSDQILENPIDKTQISLLDSETYRMNKSLQDGLARKDYFALRFGTLLIPERKTDQWKVRSLSMKDLVKRKLSSRDLVPNITQKGVDMKIGLDIASITSKKLVTKLVLISNDSDMIPAMKLARKEGVQVYLFTFFPVNDEMAMHSDVVIEYKDVKDIELSGKETSHYK